jgi:ABC-type lipoprotein export system ATPase subunit
MIACSSISKVYHSGRGSLQALANVSLRVPPQSSLALVGKSGSGKTTLLNCLGGLDRPDGGTVRYGDVDIHSLSAHDLSMFVRRRIGFVFQHGNLLSYLSVFENIAFPLVLNNMEHGRLQKRVAELLERIGLSTAGAALPLELSGGEVQRVAVARAIAHVPQVLLADEPTASLDTATGRQLINLMFEISRDQGCTLVFTTHDMESVSLADAIVHLRDGAIAAE